MCCRNRAPRCSTCRKRAPCHRRNCAANFPIVQPVYAQQRIYTSQPAPTRATGNDHDTPPSYDEMAWPAEKAVRYNGPKEDGSGQSNGLLGMIVRKYQSWMGDKDTMKALEDGFKTTRIESHKEKAELDIYRV